MPMSPSYCLLTVASLSLELYADEWEDLIGTEEQAYHETARGVGQVIDEGLVNIATKLGWVSPSCSVCCCPADTPDPAQS